jgi:SulP family sulfate permease
VSGTASVVVRLDSGEERVLRKYQQGTMLGEMALFTGENRSATVRADNDCLFFRLGRREFELAREQDSKAIAMFQSYVIRLMSERLERTNREVRALS